MKSHIVATALTCALGFALAAPQANAVVAQHFRVANSVDVCDVFTPGTPIRNRVVGQENIGTSTLALSCNFPQFVNGAAGRTNLTLVNLYFANSTSAAQTYNCTLLTGAGPNAISGGTVYSVAKSVTVGAGATGGLSFGTADNPTAGATDLGNVLVGVNCSLPVGGRLTTTELGWSMDNGVGN